MNKQIELLKKHLLSPILINEETQNAILIAIEALEQKPPVINDEEIELKKLRGVKFTFDIQSDHSTNCNGYRSLCRQIEELEAKLLTNK